MNTKSAIYVRDVYKAYGGNIVLDGLSMTVERGTIYGLLGSSGCGKTTLLNCIVGRKNALSGEIWVLGTQKENGVPVQKIGYMPQELALVEEFTVKDAIYYFGTIYNMKNKDIKQRFAELSKLLDLPPKDRYLKHCSGGQKRRVSFAAALVHNPELLILDEPTVGVDPILREKIWNYLLEQVNSTKITVIITTHYIEETKEAHKIGLMRTGKLLIEESPTKLLSTYQTATLEDVYLLLSQNQERHGAMQKSSSAISLVNAQHKNSSETISTATSVESFAMGYGSRDELTNSSKKKIPKIKPASMSALSLNKNRMKALLSKNWKQFYRNVGGLLFLATFPLAQMWFFMNSIGTLPKNLHLGIVNNESLSSLCDNNYNWNETATVDDYQCHYKDLACRFLSYLEDPMINKVSYDSLPQAVDGVKHGNIVGVVYIPSNFTESYESRLILGYHAEKWMTDFGEIKVYMDMSNKQIGPVLSYKLYALFDDFQKGILSDCNISEKLSGIPIRNMFMFGDNRQDMLTFMTPGMVLMLVYLLGSTMTSLIIVKEKLDGVWDRSIVAGVSSLEITLAHLLFEGAIMFVQCLETTLMTFYVLKTENVGSICALFTLVFLQGLCGMAYGYWISSLSSSITAANIICTGGYLPLLLVGGLIWPVEGQPLFLRIPALCLPCTLPIISFRNIMVKGWSLWNTQVLNGVGVLFGWILFFCISSVWFIKINK